MKKIAMFAFCMSAVTAFAQDALQFNITAIKKESPQETKVLESRSVMVRTVPRSQGIFTDMTEAATVNEVNTYYGQVELKPVKIHTGISGKVEYQPTKDSNVINVSVEYEWVDKSAIVSKGKHFVKATVGEAITLPGANGVEVKLVVKS